MMSRKETLGVLGHWGLADEPITDIHPKGSGEEEARAFYVGDDCVLKCSGNLDKVKNAVALCEALHSADICVSPIIRTTDGRAYVQDSGLFFYMTQRIFGAQLSAQDFYEGDHATKARIFGEAIGKLHHALRQVTASVNDVNPYESVKDWALPKIKRILPLPESFCQDYLHAFGELYTGLPKQIIHGDPNPSNIIVSHGEWGFIDFELSKSSLRMYDPCYAALAILSESFDPNDDAALSTWLDIYRNIISGYDDVIRLTDKERISLPYVVVAEQLTSTAWFSEQSGYTELFETNKRMAAWLISVFDDLGFDRIADSATVHITLNPASRRIGAANHWNSSGPQHQ